jgi:hypothetical protein
MVTTFEPHGQFKVYVDGRIIVSEVDGPWNKELVDQWAAQLYLLARELSASGPHVGIAVIRGSMLCPPDAFQTMRRALAYAVAKLQCIGSLIVADAGVEGRALMQAAYEQQYGDGAAPRMFDDLGSARAWALSLLAAEGC